MADTDKKNLKHGRETYIEEYGRFVIKRPLEKLGPVARLEWLRKQHDTKDVTDAIRAVGNPTYNIPETHFIHDGDFQVLEDFAPGVPLTRDVYYNLSNRQRSEIITSLAGFLVDMNESRSVYARESYKIFGEIKFERLGNFIENKMKHWFTRTEIAYMAGIKNSVGAFEHETCRAWSHCDLNTGNVLYDADNSKLWIIDFAEANYHYIYHDIFSPLAVELDICRPVYETYSRFHDRSLYQMPGTKNGFVRDIMKYRTLVVLLRRFIKASDDLRITPASENGAINNLNKVQFMRELMLKMHELGLSAR